MTIGTLTFEGIPLPLPKGWKPLPGGGSYGGIEGLLDPRIADHNSSDDERVRDEIGRKRGEVTNILVHGRSCLRGRFKNQDATVCTYSIDLGTGTVVRAVYVFRPGFESTVAEVETAFASQG